MVTPFAPETSFAFGPGDAISGGEDVGDGPERDLTIARAAEEAPAGGRGGTVSASTAIANGTEGIFCLVDPTVTKLYTPMP